MTTLKRNPQPTNKAGEKALYRELILATPEDSYLRTVLNESRSFVFGNIDNDIAWPVQERARIIDENITTSKAQLVKLKGERRQAEKDLANVQNELKVAREELESTLRASQRFLDMIDENSHNVRAAIRDLKKGS